MGKQSVRWKAGLLFEGTRDDRNHVRSNRYKVLPRDRQATSTRTVWVAALQNRPWKTNSFNQFDCPIVLLWQ